MVLRAAGGRWWLLVVVLAATGTKEDAPAVGVSFRLDESGLYDGTHTDSQIDTRHVITCTRNRT